MLRYGNTCILEIKGENNTIHPILIVGKENVLIDTGYPNQIELFREEMKKAGITFHDLDKIVFTHQDGDHIGLGRQIKELNLNIKLLCQEEEEPYISWKQTPIKLNKRADKIRQEGTEEEKAEIEKQIENAKKNKVDIDETFKDRDYVTKGVKAIHTPGHTPGHVCLYVEDEKLLITGDALNALDGVLKGPNPVYTYDMDLAMKSLEKLYGLDIQVISCYHGGIVTKDAVEQIKGL